MQSTVCDTEWSLWTISTPIVTIQVGCIEENRLSGFQPFDAQRVIGGGERATQQPMKEESQQNLFQYKLNLDIVVGEADFISSGCQSQPTGVSEPPLRQI